MNEGQEKKEKLNYPQTVKIGFAFFSISAFWQLYNGVIPPILTNTFGMSETASGVIMALDNILALFMLPLFGSLSDKCRSQLGRRKPFILIGTIAAVALMQFIPMMDNRFAATGLAGFRVAFIVILLLLLIAMGTYRAPAVALMPDMTPKELRSKGNAIINLMGALGAIIYLLITTLLYSGKLFMDDKGHVDYTLLFVIVAMLMIGALLVVMLTVKEPVQERPAEEASAETLPAVAEEAAAPEEVSAAVVAAEQNASPAEQPAKESHKLPKDVRRSFLFLLATILLWFMSYNAIETWYTSYAGRVWGMTIGTASACLTVITVGMIITYIPAAFLASKIGRRKTVLAGLFLEIVPSLTVFIYTLVADSMQRKAYLSQMATDVLQEGGLFGVSEMTAVPSVLFGSYEEANAVYLAGGFHPAMFAVLSLFGIGAALINVNTLPMVVDMCAESDVGKYTGYYYTASMAAQIATPVLAGWFLDHVGYFTLFLYVAVFVGGAIATMWFVRHGDTTRTAVKGLEVFEEM
ncbi:MAG: MFS transporter [Lachnospiraceae bacterium]|nr:MFS transporter [Lachnospiraceae bacterium]